MTDIDDLIESARLPRTTIPVCLRGDLRARWDELHTEFKKAPAAGGSLGDPSPRAGLAQQLEELRAEIDANQIPFTFEALSGPEFSKLLAAHPGKGGNRVDLDSLPPALIAACCLDPKMDTEQASRLLGRLSAAQGSDLFDAAWSVNQDAVDVPFDVSVYAATRADDAS